MQVTIARRIMASLNSRIMTELKPQGGSHNDQAQPGGHEQSDIQGIKKKDPGEHEN